MLRLRHLFKPFEINGDPARVRREQTIAFASRGPYLYFILSVNTLALAATHIGVAPPVLSVFAPLALVIILMARAVYWWRLRVDALSDEQCTSIIRKAPVLSVVLGVIMLAWAISLYSYDIHAPPGHLTGRGQIAVFVCLTLLSSIVLLKHLRLATILGTLTIVPAFALFLFIEGTLAERLVGLNMVLVAAAMLVVALDSAKTYFKVLRITHEQTTLAHTDALTGLLNRRGFFRALAERRLSGENHAVLMLDLRGFKQINDQHGHKAGDVLLQGLTQRLRERLPPDMVIARLGGNEFALIATPLSVPAEAMAFGEQVLALCTAPIDLGDGTARVGVAIGISLSHDAPAADHFERASWAVFEAKRHEDARVQMFNPELAAGIERRSAILQALQRADFAREFALFLQPIVAAKGSAVLGYEALLRWTSPSLGAVSPAEFIPIAEGSAVINDITAAVLAQALEIAPRLDDGQRLKINLSVRDLSSPQQMLKLVAMIEASAVPPRLLTFEMTETALSEDIESMKRSVAMLRALGCAVAIDDFGIGYSNLTYISELMPDVIKIDRSFIVRIDSDPRAASLIKTIIELCHNINARSVAEGVESEAQASMLRGFGCDEFQGYLFGRPLPWREALARFGATADAATGSAA